jgi:hypothetical protein
MMDDQERNEQIKVEEELQDLKKELENFEKEKERVRTIVGKIGGVPKTQAKFVNALFIAVIAVSVIVSIVAGEKWRLIMI